jgi:hypothetical protein
MLARTQRMVAQWSFQKHIRTQQSVLMQQDAVMILI